MLTVDMVTKKALFDECRLLNDEDTEKIEKKLKEKESFNKLMSIGKFSCKDVFEQMKGNPESTGQLPSGTPCLDNDMEFFYDCEEEQEVQDPDDSGDLFKRVLKQTAPQKLPIYVQKENAFFTLITDGGLLLRRPVEKDMDLRQALAAAEELAQAANQELEKRNVPVTPFGKLLAAAGVEHGPIALHDKVALVALEGDTPNQNPNTRFCFCLDFDYEESDKPLLMFRLPGLCWFKERVVGIKGNLVAAENAWREANGGNSPEANKKVAEIYKEYFDNLLKFHAPEGMML